VSLWQRPLQCHFSFNDSGAILTPSTDPLTQLLSLAILLLYFSGLGILF
jgi:Sec-independent protein secretion pathway component TatC